MAPPPPPPPPRPANQEHKSSFSFSSSKPTNSGGPSPELAHHMSDVNRRVRMVEESLTNLRKKVELENENTLSDKRSNTADIQAIYEELAETKKIVRTVQDTITKMIKEVQTLAKKEDVQVLQKYVNIWKPIQFVTQQEVTSIVQAEVARLSRSSIQNKPRQAMREENTQTESTTEHININNESEEIPRKNVRARQTQESSTVQTHTTTSSTHTPTDEQKRRIAQFIDAHDDIKDLILHDVDDFIQKVSKDDMLQVLFKGVDLHAFSQKLQGAYGVTAKKSTSTTSRNDEIFGNHKSDKLDDMLKK